MPEKYLVFLQLDETGVKEEWFDSRTEAQDNFDALRAVLDYMQEVGALSAWAGYDDHVIYLLLVRAVNNIPEEWPILRKEEYHTV